MRTSKQIKQYQHHPVQAAKHSGNLTYFDSESRDRVQYAVRRNGRDFRCGCKARGLCKHVTAVVLEAARPKWRTVQVWTDEADARRQHRRTERFWAHGTPFWVTYAGEREADLDAEVLALSEEYAAWQRKICHGGQEHAERRAEMERLRPLLMDAQVARERAVGERMRAA